MRAPCRSIFSSSANRAPHSFCRLAKKNEIHIHSGDWPVLLYDMTQYDPKEPRAGLLRSSIGTTVSRDC